VADEDQIKIHPNPFSKEGLGQKVMDMGVAIAKLATDMEWVKDRLAEIIEKLEKNDREINEMMKSYQSYVDQRFEGVDEKFEALESRVEDLESFRDKVKGAALVIGTLITSGLIIWALNHAFG